MCHIRWHKQYLFHYGTSTNIHDTLLKLTEIHPLGVPIQNTEWFNSYLNQLGINLPCPVGDCDDIIMTAIISAHEGTVSINVDDEETDEYNICASSVVSEVCFSPYRLLQARQSTPLKGNVCNDAKGLTYNDTIKIFNMVFNLMETQPHGVHHLQQQLWSTYHDTVKKNSQTGDNIPKGQVISLPAVFTSPNGTRKHTAGII
jgi:hypothetical protein